MNLQSLSLSLAKKRIQKWIGWSRTLSSSELAAKLEIKQSKLRELMGAARVRQDSRRRWVTDEVVEVLQNALDGGAVYDPLKEQWNEWATTFCLGELDLFEDGPQKVYIKAMPQRDGSVKWAVVTPETNGWCLTKDLEWLWEPKPGDRDHEYFQNTRYNSKGEALVMLRRFKEEKEKSFLHF